MRPSFLVLVLGLLPPESGCSAPREPDPPLAAPAGPTPVPADAEMRPFLALWSEPHHAREPYAPIVRFAFWDDGRVLAAVDPTRRGAEVRRGRIDPASVALLKTRLAASGVFDLKRTSSLVPDGGEDCVLIDLGARQTMLHWDEVETPGYGINIDPTPDDREFIRCWKAINALGLAAVPEGGEVAPAPRMETRDRWRLPPTDPGR